MSLIRNIASTHEKIRLQYIGSGLSKKSGVIVNSKDKNYSDNEYEGKNKVFATGMERLSITVQYGVFLPPLIGSLEWLEQVLGQLAAFALVVNIFRRNPYFIHPLDTEYCTVIREGTSETEGYRGLV